ncbi:MAG: hypothetical protein WAO35_17395 [Terriglobia bacterium]
MAEKELLKFEKSSGYVFADLGLTHPEQELSNAASRCGFTASSSSVALRKRKRGRSLAFSNPASRS